MRNYSFIELTVGQQESFEVELSCNTLNQFRELSGDENPLHDDESYAKACGFVGRVVYGMQLASYFSQLVGMHLPGKKSLYVSQEVNFRRPAVVGDRILVKGIVVQKVPSIRLLVISTEILRLETNDLLVDGRACVKMIEDYDAK